MKSSSGSSRHVSLNSKHAPKIILILAFVTGILFDFILDLPGWVYMSDWFRISMAIIGLCASGYLAFVSAREFKRYEDVSAQSDDLTLVTTGPLRASRNPVYVAAFGVIAFLGLLVNSSGVSLALVIAMVIVHFKVVRREEVFLGSTIGGSYFDYCAWTPRYVLDHRWLRRTARK